MAEGLSGRMLMEHRDAQGQGVFTSRAWRRLFEIRGPLLHELILEFFSTFRFGDAVLDVDTTRALQRSQALKKVAVTDLFDPRGMDVGSVNILYLLARYLRLFALGRKQGDMISGAPGPERQQVVATGATKTSEDAPIVDEDASVVLAPMQAPQLPPPIGGPANTMAQRLGTKVRLVRGGRLWLKRSTRRVERGVG
ncbi:hypothetical protein Tco_0683045 [Tanacetum coccineum]|uniref:Uncharacterized protein n=1 Tax=Tanacetum coccineum TaxID=301880 RepID=A0ABQ4XTZ7_9ASTR